ncbi:MAG: hypothetical protein NWP80_00890 [Candidatus Gracilibacteria bacterium]|nr:hypothetical protein [Candidatus Gracilibacteria bacterium]
MEYLLIIVIFILLLGTYLIYKYSNKRKISKSELKKFNDLNNKIYKNKNISNSEKIISFDKLYHKILLSVQYSGTFGEILKQKPVIISNLDTIWKLHKLRNKISHEFIYIKDKDLLKNTELYFSEIKTILKKIF